MADPQYELGKMWNVTIKEYEKATKVPLPSNAHDAISRDDVLHVVEEEQKQFTQFCIKGQVGRMVNTVLGLVESLARMAGEGLSMVSFGFVCIVNLLTC